MRLALSGEEEGKLRFSVAVNGGTAVVTCPVQRVRIENDASPSETRELWLRGDVLAAAGKPAEARAAYQLALEKSEPNSSYRRLIEIKLDALGEAK